MSESEYPKVTVLVGSMTPAMAWCREADKNPRDPSILLGITGTEVVRHLQGRRPEDVTIILVMGWGQRSAQWERAREEITRFRAMGADVRVWVGY
jgi:hypothetical protein